MKTRARILLAASLTALLGWAAPSFAETSGATLRASSAHVWFGWVAVDTYKSVPVTVTNLGPGVLELAAPVLQGSPAFHIERTTCGKVLSPRALCIVSVTYSATEDEALPAAELVLETVGGTQSVVVTLTAATESAGVESRYSR